MTLIPANLRNAVVARAGNRCEYCLLSQDLQVATFPVDHIVPVALGGPTILENLALACPRCNQRKHAHIQSTDPVSGEIVLLFNPRTQDWNQNFCWSVSDLAIIEALTPSGRATIALLELNDQQHQAIRRSLIVLKLHPPV